MKHLEIRMLISALTLLVICASVSARSFHRIEDFDEPMPEFVAECRRGCLLKFLEKPLKEVIESDCSRQSNCFMCWDYCLLLHKVRKNKFANKFVTTLMCMDNVCIAGCKFACNYYQYLMARPMQRTDHFFL